MVASVPVLGKHKALLKGRKPSVELIPLAKVLCAAVFEVAKFFLFALREGGHALRGEEMARSCFAAPSTHTCPV